MEEPGRASLGWGVVAPDLSRVPVQHSDSVASDETTQRSSSMPASSTAGPALPPDVIKAFLESHQMQKDELPPMFASAASIDTLCAVAGGIQNDDEAATPSSSMVHIPNPFAVASSNDRQQQPQQQQPPAAPDIAARYPQQQQQQASTAVASSRQSRPRSLLRRLVRGLVLTGVSAGLVAAGAWGGRTAYRHYLTQLDDRDQLQKRVEELRKQEAKLVHRCTSVEQERDHLREKVSELSTSLSDANLAKTELKQQLKSLTSDRDEAVRHNLKLQSKLSALEEDYAGLAQVNKEAIRELNESKVQLDRLTKEAGQLSVAVEKLESRVAQLDAVSTKSKDSGTNTGHQRKSCCSKQ